MNDAPRIFPTAFTVTGRLAASILDLASIDADLMHVSRTSQWLGTVSQSDLDDEPTRWQYRCAWESCVISYGRCFESGKGHLLKQPRTQLPNEIMNDLPKDLRKLHETLLKHERSQHVAHRVGPKETADLRGTLTAMQIRLDPMIWRQETRKPAWMAEVNRLADYLSARVKETIQARQQDLMAHLKADLRGLMSAMAESRPYLGPGL